MDALELLGYKTYFTKKLLSESYGSKHFINWKHLVDTDCQSENAKDLLKEMLEVDAQATAVSYIGGVVCLEQLLELYPQAKIIHTERANADIWVESLIEAPCVMFPKLAWAGKFLDKPLRAYEFFDSFVNKLGFGQPPGTFPPNPETCRQNEDVLKELYLAHNEKISARVPPERFLYFAKSEWSSLANFLEKEAPSTKYPRSNSRKEFNRQINRILGGMFVFVVIGVVMALAAILRMRKRKKTKEA